jgi:hypothetical protein
MQDISSIRGKWGRGIRETTECVILTTKLRLYKSQFYFYCNPTSIKIIHEAREQQKKSYEHYLV